MREITPSFLLRNPEIVTPQAPWCVALEPLELATVALAQPWLAGPGLTRAELERQLGRLAAELPLGVVYFQRVKRAVARLESIQILEAQGARRSQRFSTTPEGFAALLLNLRVPQADPTLDGAPFELKRSLVTRWHLMLTLAPPAQSTEPEAIEPAATDKTAEGSTAEAYLERLDGLQVLGHPVVDRSLLADAFDIRRLVATERHHVEGLRTILEKRFERLEHHRVQQAAPIVSAEVFAVLRQAGSGVQTLQSLAFTRLPRLQQAAVLTRYDRFLHYLDALDQLYRTELQTLEPRRVRQTLASPWPRSA